MAKKHKNKKPPRFAVVHRAKWVDGPQVPKVIVLHDTESKERENSTADIQGIFNYLDSVKLSVHACVDADGNIGTAIPGNMKGRHAPPNSGKIGIEQIGQASWTKKQWYARPKLLRKTALLMAWYSYRWDIPLTHSTTHGVCQHKDLPEGGHHDCGDGYPIGAVMRMAKAYRRTVYSGTYQG